MSRSLFCLPVTLGMTASETEISEEVANPMSWSGSEWCFCRGTLPCVSLVRDRSQSVPIVPVASSSLPWRHIEVVLQYGRMGYYRIPVAIDRGPVRVWKRFTLNNSRGNCRIYVVRRFRGAAKRRHKHASGRISQFGATIPCGAPCVALGEHRHQGGRGYCRPLYPWCQRGAGTWSLDTNLTVPPPPDDR